MKTKNYQNLFRFAGSILLLFAIIGFLAVFNPVNAQMELIYTDTKAAYEGKSYEVVNSLTLESPFHFSAEDDKTFFATTNLVSQPNAGILERPQYLDMVRISGAFT